MKMNNIFAVIEKYEKLDNDVILISGIASSETMDNQNEIVNSEAMKAAIPEYLSLGGTGALREMHQSKAAGSVFKAEVMEDGRTHIEARVVDKEACKKIEQGVYKGFSIGGKILKKEGNIITKVKLTEISLVDRPCNPEALFSMYKCDDIEAIKGNIIEAWKKAKEEAKNSPEAKKYDSDINIAQSMGLNNIQRLSCLIQDLSCLQDCMEYEEEMEIDKSVLPEELTLAISNLYDILVRMAQEEQAEFNVNKDEMKMSDNTKDLSKYDSSSTPSIENAPGAKFNTDPSSVLSQANDAQRDQTYPKQITEIQQSIGEIKAALIARGYDIAPIKADNLEEWKEKSEKSEDLSKALIEDLKNSILDISERISKIEGQPASTKSVLKKVSESGSPISKSEDVTGKDIAKVDRNLFGNVSLEDKDFQAMDAIKGMYS